MNGRCGTAWQKKTPRRLVVDYLSLSYQQHSKIILKDNKGYAELAGLENAAVEISGELVYGKQSLMMLRDRHYRRLNMETFYLHELSLRTIKAWRGKVKTTHK